MYSFTKSRSDFTSGAKLKQKVLGELVWEQHDHLLKVDLSFLAQSQGLYVENQINCFLVKQLNNYFIKLNKSTLFNNTETIEKAKDFSKNVT